MGTPKFFGSVRPHGTSVSVGGSRPFCFGSKWWTAAFASTLRRSGGHALKDVFSGGSLLVEWLWLTGRVAWSKLWPDLQRSELNYTVFCYAPIGLVSKNLHFDSSGRIEVINLAKACSKFTRETC